MGNSSSVEDSCADAEPAGQTREISQLRRHSMTGFTVAGLSNFYIIHIRWILSGKQQFPCRIDVETREGAFGYGLRGHVLIRPAMQAFPSVFSATSRIGPHAPRLPFCCLAVGDVVVVDTVPVIGGGRGLTFELLEVHVVVSAPLSL